MRGYVMARANFKMSCLSSAVLLYLLVIAFVIAAPNAGACDGKGCNAEKKSESEKQPQPVAAAYTAVESSNAGDTSTAAGGAQTTPAASDSAAQVSSNPIPLKIGEDKHECTDPSHKVSCVGAHAACPESEKVIETLKQLASAYTEGNFVELAKFMDDGVTTFDEGTHRLIVGKQAVVDDIKKRWEAAHAANAPVLSYTINNPYAQVTGDRAVVTFEAIKTVGGKHPETLVSRCTDIFVKRDDGWKKLHYRLCWKKSKSGT